MSHYLIQQLKQSNDLNKFYKEIYIELDCYFKYSGMIEYKNRFTAQHPVHDPVVKEKINNDMSKYKLKKNK
tara:strand:- start:4935 stop:5147 length:213 start_codon:yes stop_codon:yes gene_type:complete